MKKLGDSQYWGALIIIALFGFGFGEQFLRRSTPTGPLKYKDLPLNSQIPMSSGPLPSNGAPALPNSYQNYPTVNYPPVTPQLSPATNNYSNPPNSYPNQNGSYSPPIPNQDNNSNPNLGTGYPQSASAPSSSHRKQLPAPNSININTASETELEQLPGVGPGIATRIINYRTQNGPFSSIDQLRSVKGIGPKRLAKIAPYIYY